MKQKILSLLPPGHPWGEKLHYYEEVDSTNTLAKALANAGAPAGTVIIADRQTGGRGRMGRSFHSPGGMGVYMSLILRPDCTPDCLMHLTCATAVAMCDAVQNAAGFRPGIKWTNDLVFDQRKLGGILTELGLRSDGRIAYAVIGIGINCNQQPEDLPPEIASMAASLSMVTGSKTDRACLCAAMMDALYGMETRLLTEREAILEQYRRECVTLGKEVSVLYADGTVRHGKALSVDLQGGLAVAFSDGETATVSSGEVSVRGMYGYL